MIQQQDFELYAEQKIMNGGIANIWEQRFKECVLSNFLSLSERKILDYGCGDGRYYHYFKQYFIPTNIYGLEVSQTRVERAKTSGWKNITLVGQKQKLPYEDGFFDIVHCDQVIEHIFCNDLDFYLEEIKRVLKTGGIIFFITPNYPIKRIYDFYEVIRFRKWQRFKDDQTHVCFFSFKKALDIFSRYFSNVQVIPSGGLFFKYIPYNFFSHKIFITGIK